MKKWTRWVVWGVAAVVVIAVALSVFRAAAGPQVQVRTAPVVSGELEKIVSASGEVRARADIDVYPAVQSTIKRVLVTDEQHVTIGQPLVILDSEPYQIAKAQAYAGIEQAQSGAHVTQKQEPTWADYRAADSAEYAAWYAYKLARDAWLYPKPTVVGTVTIPPDKKQLRLQMLQAYSGYRQAVSGRRRLDVAADTGPELSAADASEEQAQLAYDKAVHDLAATTVRAPIAGRVFLDNFAGTSLQGPARKIARGQAVGPQSPLVRIVDPRRMKFSADVDEADIVAVNSAQRARITLDAFSDKAFSGKVSSISILSKTTQSGGSAFSVAVLLPIGTKGLRVGMSGTADITVAKRPAALQVPVEAVVQRDGKDVVFVVEASVAKMRPVQLGLSTDTVYEVRSGLSEGQRVVTSGLEGLKDGTRVGEKR